MIFPKWEKSYCPQMSRWILEWIISQNRRMIWFMHIKKGKLHRSFVGYAIQHSDLLIGLGASAMSDSWTVFA